VTAFRLTGAPETWPALPPVGRPISNVTIYILDQHQQLAAVGVPGELYIGGPVLARGYFHRPDLTAERFVPDPFPPSVPPPGGDERGDARLYKTGDLARYLPDGDIEFLGRIDQQVKVRGYRIEPGEVEAVLARHPGVREAVVVAMLTARDQAGDRQLLAYVVLDPERAPGVGELRRFLQEKLPVYMIPSSFTILEALPLTPSGKVNRRALPAPDRAQPELGAGFVAPRTPTEETLADICAQVLGLDQVGVHDNFFDLGGHSLLATQFMSRVHDTFHVDLPLRRLFEMPTVAGLAQAIDGEQQAEPSPTNATTIFDNYEEERL
jgi:acyl carrier protein